MDGKSKVKGEIYFGESGSGVNLLSDLEGIAVNMPQPFKKVMSDKKNVSMHLPFEGDKRELQVSYGEGVIFSFLLCVFH